MSAPRLYVLETRLDVEKAERLGGVYWVETRHTATGERLPERFCPHFATRADAVAWIRERTCCEWCGAATGDISGFCSPEHERLHEIRYVSPRFYRKAVPQ